jgi:hypothetical protein
MAFEEDLLPRSLDAGFSATAKLSAKMVSVPPLRVFLSYSHVDEAWKDRVSRHLAVLTEEGLLDVWDDRRIGAGADWEAEIRAAMDAADVAILLISADLLTSRFVRDSEVPRLLQRRAKEGVRVIPILVHPCLWKKVPWLAALQIRPWNGKALASLRSDRVDEALVAIAEEILKPPAGHSEGELREPEGSGGRESTAHIDAREQPVEHARTEGPGLKPSLLDWARQKPVEAITATAALVTALGAGLGTLGLVTERTREGLIGIPPLSYSKPDLLLTGAQSLWSLPWRAVAALAAPHPVLRWSAFACLLLATALLAGAWFPRRGAVALITLACSAGALLFGAWLCSAAVHTGLETPGAGRGLACEEQLSRRWDVSAAFETCTWLINDTPRNEERRQGLGGVLGFLLLAAGGGVWMGARSQSLRPRESWARWGLVAVHGALALFFLRLVPAAHAYSTWGVRYPPVTVRTDLPGCDPALGQALAASSCCAFNVSAGATEGTVLLLWGSGCPGGAGFKTSNDVEAIGKGCLSQALTPRTVNSRCL